MQNEGFKYCQLLSDLGLGQLSKISVRNDIQLIWFIFNSLKGKGKWFLVYHSNWYHPFHFSWLDFYFVAHASIHKSLEQSAIQSCFPRYITSFQLDCLIQFGRSIQFNCFLRLKVASHDIKIDSKRLSEFSSRFNWGK